MCAKGLDSEMGSHGAKRASNPLNSAEGREGPMIFEAISQGGAALRGNPLRAGLGALAIAVAVATIVLVVSALDGVALYAKQSTARTFGSDTFLIAQVASPGRVSRRELQEQLQRNPPIRAIGTEVPRAVCRWPGHLRPERPDARGCHLGRLQDRERLDHRDDLAACGHPRPGDRARPVLPRRRRPARRAGGGDRRRCRRCALPGAWTRSGSRCGSPAASSR